MVIEINLEKDVEYDDLKTMPAAQNITDKQITWKVLIIYKIDKIITSLIKREINTQFDRNKKIKSIDIVTHKNKSKS